MSDRARTGFAAGVLALAVMSAGATAEAATAKPLPSAKAAAVKAKAKAKARAPAPPAPPSPTVAGFAGWVAASKDNMRRPYAVVDKVDARVFVFDGRGKLKGSAPVLLGLAAGDDSAPGVGDHSELSTIPGEERTTPAGRFFAWYGAPDRRGERVLWIDHKIALSMHQVIKGTPRDKRLQRLSSATPEDNRITFGCINVPGGFYRTVVRPTFAVKNGGVVYILPDTKPLKAVFPTADVPEPLRQAAAEPAPEVTAEAAREAAPQVEPKREPASGGLFGKLFAGRDRKEAKAPLAGG
jgi:hypothetical protein